MDFSFPKNQNINNLDNKEETINNPGKTDNIMKKFDDLNYNNEKVQDNTKYFDSSSESQDKGKIQPNKTNITLSINYLKNIKSTLILKLLFNNFIEYKILKLIQYNKTIQKRLNININNYKDFRGIEIEISISKKKYGKFININKKDKSYYYIYINNNKKPIKKNYIDFNDNILNINIKINNKINSFYKLFQNCECIESMNFIKFDNKNINNMSYMFQNCSSIKNINFSNYYTNNVTNMCNMFHSCSSLEDLDLSSFNTDNVIDMSSMFYKCSSLKRINITNFNTINVIDLSGMFNCCSSLKDLVLSSFNTSKVIDMSNMFCGCSSLKELNIFNFKIDKVTNMSYMFYDCSSLEILIIRNFNNNIIDINNMFKGCNNNLKIIKY